MSWQNTTPSCWHFWKKTASCLGQRSSSGKYYRSTRPSPWKSVDRWSHWVLLRHNTCSSSREQGIRRHNPLMSKGEAYLALFFSFDFPTDYMEKSPQCQTPCSG